MTKDFARPHQNKYYSFISADRTHHGVSTLKLSPVDGESGLSGQGLPDERQVGLGRGVVQGELGQLTPDALHAHQNRYRVGAA